MGTRPPTPKPCATSCYASSRLAEEVPEIVELDLNPVIALPPGNGCRIVDARIRVARR